MIGAQAEAAAQAGPGRRVLTVGNPDGLERIHDPEVHLVRRPRPIPESQGAWLAALPASGIPRGRLKVPLGAVEAAVGAAFEARGVTASAGPC